MQIKIIKFEEKEKESGFFELTENEYKETESENKQKNVISLNGQWSFKYKLQTQSPIA